MSMIRREERRIECVDKIAQASVGEKKKGRVGKKIYIKVKRGKLDGVVGSKSKTGEKGERERERRVSSLRVLFLLLCSGSALMFSLLQLPYSPFDPSWTIRDRNFRRRSVSKFILPE